MNNKSIVCGFTISGQMYWQIIITFSILAECSMFAIYLLQLYLKIYNFWLFSISFFFPIWFSICTFWNFTMQRFVVKQKATLAEHYSQNQSYIIICSIFCEVERKNSSKSSCKKKGGLKLNISQKSTSSNKISMKSINYSSRR